MATEKKIGASYRTASGLLAAYRNCAREHICFACLFHISPIN